jgi:hypothetical protein
VTLSEGRLSHLAQLLLRAVTDGKLGTVRSDHRFLSEAKQALTDEFSLDTELDRLARARMPRHVMPGSRDWDVRYRQYYEEERRKLGR